MDANRQQAPAQALRIESRSIDALVPYASNARTHSSEQVGQIASSLREFGWTNPILVDGDSGVVAGHGRLLAAKLIRDGGLTIPNWADESTVPVIELAHLTPEQRRTYIIADNKLALNAGWDTDALTLELQALNDEGADLLLTGFSNDEIAALINGWEADIDPRAKHGENLDGVSVVISIRVDADEEQQAREVITNALEAAGVTFTL